MKRPDLISRYEFIADKSVSMFLTATEKETETEDASFNQVISVVVASFVQQRAFCNSRVWNHNNQLTEAESSRGVSNRSRHRVIFKKIRISCIKK